MRAPDRLPAGFWEALQERPHMHDLFHVLRWIDARAQNAGRLGRTARPSAEPVRLRQEASMAFAPAALAPARAPRPGTPPEISIYSFGLFGPNGPLPLHLTEFARERQHHHGDATLTAFADMFHHRLIALFYRAWADAQATVEMDRADNRFERHVACLVNLGAPSMRERDHVPDHAKFAMAPYLVRQTRNPEGLAHILASYFGVPVVIRENVAQWIELEADQCLALRAGGSQVGGLGRDSVMGRAVRDAQHKFRIELGPLAHEDYLAFLPGTSRARKLNDWLRQYIGLEFAWDVRLIMRREDVSGTRLKRQAGAPLGLGTWLGRRDALPGDAGDLVIDLAARTTPTAPRPPAARAA